MALNRWSLDRLVAWIGMIATTILFVPMGVYLMVSVSSSSERSLADRGRMLASTLAAQITDNLLVDDRLAMHDALDKAALADSEIRYLCVTDPQGEIVAHTFDGGYPHALTEIWRKGPAQLTRFRTRHAPLMNIPVPIMTGLLGTVHVGMSRAGAMQSARRMMAPMWVALAGALCFVLVGARVVAANVSRPLRRLDAEVQRYPQSALLPDGPTISGTKEVRSLAAGFADMAKRLESLERERETTRQRMQHAEQLAALGELAAGLAHEIHNPLDGMLECVRYMEADPAKGDRAAKYLPMVSEGLERIVEVMKQMLALARSGHDTAVEVCSAAEISDSLNVMLEGHLEARKVKLTWRKNSPGVCLCNRNGLSQAVLNLVLNAAEASEGHDDPEIVIDVHNDSRWVYLAVSDCGPGVPEDLRERIFEPFFTTKPGGRGTGLGLAISRQLIRAAGGELELMPEASGLGGACFRIRLPAAAEEPANG